MKIVFLDTVGLIALWDQRDQWHLKSKEAFKKILADDAIAITTDVVLLECGNALSRTIMRPAVINLRNQLRAGNRLIVPETEEIEIAWREYASGSRGGAGIVDIVSFQVMQRMRVTDAFTNDQHFKTAGFTTLF